MVTKKRLIKELVSELSSNNLAIFAGAGLSVDSGYVDWKSLLKDIIEELDLDPSRETDYVTLAQYYVNTKQANRSKINQIIIDEFSAQAKITENHDILARLPISTYWTTNYDNVIELALRKHGKIVDVKHRVAHLLTTIRNRDATLYKMHGDYENPTEAVIIKDDYEKYSLERNEFYTALRGDLLTKRFLFLGFGFSDPNIDYILSRVRASYSTNQKTHYCILRKIKKISDEDQAEFEYRLKKQQFFIQDLQRVGVESLLVNEYSEITELLRDIECYIKRKTVFISGAAHNYAPYNKEEIEEFISSLTKEILALGFRIVSGFGLGIGSAVISGAVEYLTNSGKKISEDHIILRPFPQGDNMKELWGIYRDDMISYAGISLFLFGNKLHDNKLTLSNGLKDEFDISKNKGNYLLPIGGTGNMAEILWEECMKSSSISEHSKEKLKLLSPKITNLLEIKNNIISILTNLNE